MQIKTNNKNVKMKNQHSPTYTTKCIELNNEYYTDTSDKRDCRKASERNEMIKRLSLYACGAYARSVKRRVKQ